MNIELAYGDRTAEAELGFGRVLGTLDIADMPAVEDVDQAVRSALASPIGLDQSFCDTVTPGDTVAILVSDQFRQTRVDQVLPPLIDELNEAWIPDESISLTFATGTHRPPTRDEQAAIVGQAMYDRFADRTFVHDPADTDNLVSVGTTSRGTPVAVNRRVVESDRIIVTGAVVLHYFGGYGGGRKSVVPGISSIETIAHNHAMNLHPTENRLDPAVRIGALEGNPVAEDMLDAARFVHVDCIINTVLNRNAEIAGVFAGELDAAHRTAAAFARDLYAVPIHERADLVIASSGTTRNFVQTHKALYNSYQAVKPEGRIVLLAQCPEGLGGDQFVKWLRLGSPEAIIAALRKQSEINGQTALSTLQKAPVTVLVTDLSDADVAHLHARRADTLADALDTVRTDLEAAGIPEPTIYLMPSAAYTVPFAE